MPSAARIRWAKFRVTVVSVVAVLILCALLYQLFGSALLEPQSVVYLYVPDATGLSKESPIRVDGIDVGRVSSVELSGSKEHGRVVKVTLSLHRDRLRIIPSDSLSQISSDSLVGDKFVDITSGKSTKVVVPGGEINYKDQPELLRSLDLTQFTQQLRLLDAVLTDLEEGRSQFGKFFQGQDFYNDLQKRLLDVQTAFRDATSTTSMVGGLIGSDAIHRQISDILVRLDQTVAQVQSGQGPAGQLLRDTAQYDQLLSSVQAFRHSIEGFAANDLLRSDSAYVSANRMLADLIQKVDDLNRNPQLTSTDFYETLNGSLQELRDTVRDFRLNPGKYLRLKVF